MENGSFEDIFPIENGDVPSPWNQQLAPGSWWLEDEFLFWGPASFLGRLLLVSGSVASS